MRLSELREKEVINCRDCERLGYPNDLAFDVRNGCLEALIVPGPCKLFGLLGHEQEYIIPWKCIRQIGSDIILVDIRTEDCLRTGSYTHL
ncbi:MAG: YlmC/YmxH family sporulation protein, partial [Lachnospiraceae bacterium]|nr:YlmC/YmxH family sporulation protein [Lachnospiraceae bacterium]